MLLIAALVIVIVVQWGQRQLDFQRTQTAVVEAAHRLSGSDGSPAILAELSRAQRDLATFVRPSVVHIESTIRPHAGFAGATATGSGWIWDDAGHVVTARHVVNAADQLNVQLHDGTVRRGHVVASDPRTDIAVLQIDPGRTIPATRSVGPPIQQGDLVFAFGSPLDFRFSVTSGVVSGLGRNTHTLGGFGVGYENLLQVDAPINPGSSGGPMTNHLGHIVGMSSSIAASSGMTGEDDRFAGVALAVPLPMIESVVPQLIDSGSVARGFLGVNLLDLDAPLSAMIGPGAGRGGLVVADGGRTDLRRGDIVWSVGGETPHAARSLVDAISASGEIDIERTFPVTGDERVSDVVRLLSDDPKGLQSRPFAAMGREYLSDSETPPRGAVVHIVHSETPAARAGLRPGDVIATINGKSIDTVDQLRSILATYTPGTRVELGGWRRGDPAADRVWTPMLADWPTNDR